MRPSIELPPDDPADAPTPRQQAFLNRHRLQPDRPVDFYEAAQTIGRFIRDRRQLAPTPRQEKLLKAHGKWREGMTRGEAFDQIQRLLA